MIAVWYTVMLGRPSQSQSRISSIKNRNVRLRSTRRGAPALTGIQPLPTGPSRLEENFAEVQTRTRKTDTREKLNSKRTAVFDLMNPTDRGPLRTAGSTSSSSGSKKSQSGTEDRPPRQSSSRAEARSTKTRSSDALAQVKRESGGMTRHKMNTVKNEDVSDPKSDRARGKQREQEQKPGEDSDEDGLEITDAPTKPNPRHHDGTVIEAIELGPVEHKAPPGDPTFETIEPNSGIALKCVAFWRRVLARSY